MSESEYFFPDEESPEQMLSVLLTTLVQRAGGEVVLKDEDLNTGEYVRLEIHHSAEEQNVRVRVVEIKNPFSPFRDFFNSPLN